jgi:hypothetical protein
VSAIRSGWTVHFPSAFQARDHTMLIKATPWSESSSELYRQRPRPRLVGEVIANILRMEGVAL